MTKEEPVTLTLAIPALNEAPIIMGNVNELKHWMAENLPDLIFEVLIIDDGSTDGMGELLDEEALCDKHLRVVHHSVNMGRGHGVRTAMKASRGEYLIVLDADLSYGPEHIPALLEPLQSGMADVTLASPYHKDGEVRNVPRTRAAISRWGNRILANSFRSDISTATCIVRGYNREVMDHLELVNDGKDLHLELLYKAEILGFRIKEIPAKLIWRDPNRGKPMARRGGWLLDNPLIKMRRVFLSHFLFNFIAKPKFLFLGPVIMGLLISIWGTMSLLWSFVARVVAGEPTPLRQTLIDGQLTLSLTVVALILSVFFLFIFFVASQAKRYFEEQYILATRSHYVLKKVQARLDHKTDI